MKHTRQVNMSQFIRNLVGEGMDEPEIVERTIRRFPNTVQRKDWRSRMGNEIHVAQSIAAQRTAAQADKQFLAGLDDMLSGK